MYTITGRPAGGECSLVHLLAKPQRRAFKHGPGPSRPDRNWNGFDATRSMATQSIISAGAMWGGYRLISFRSGHLERCYAENRCFLCIHTSAQFAGKKVIYRHHSCKFCTDLSQTTPHGRWKSRRFQGEPAKRAAVLTYKNPVEIQGTAAITINAAASAPK
jgi:hypothetical protein